ncbi:MAG: hypothetical protein K0Q72_3587 [Armatimonadetes bacterium]|nr:hypothetical protein [Armatimonadota bacterium]
MAGNRSVELAREFRKEPTCAENLLWQRIRGERLAGLRFRRQHPLGGAIADFYLAEARLVIEVDGEVHNYPEIRERDQARDEWMKEHGLTVLRITNQQVLTDLETVLNEILTVANAAT